MLARHHADEAIESLTRGESWDRLPGTRREVEAIAALFPKDRVTTLFDKDATESVVQRMAVEGALKNHRYLHFATHGESNPHVAMSSALILASDADRSADPLALETDGRITAQQIVNTWDLDADLVVLSACESGLGQYAAGEGYLGFTQALFVKGARSVVLSQWKVNDRATSLLMERFYQNMFGRRGGQMVPLPKAEALREAKDWLRGLSDVELAALERGTVRKLPGKPVESPRATPPTPGRYAHPYYWAGFILVGDPN
jgi:CHAT domain-containing protein